MKADNQIMEKLAEILDENYDHTETKAAVVQLLIVETLVHISDILLEIKEAVEAK